MKAKILILAGIALVAGLIYFPRAGSSEPDAVPLEVDGGKLRRMTESAEIFQRAFWCRPRTEDKILHAERREWVSESDGVRKWEWFLAIEPGSGLVEDLRRRFSLAPATLAAGEFAAAPDWFRRSPTKGSRTLSSQDGSMTLVLSPDQRLLLATGSGGGFARVAGR